MEEGEFMSLKLNNMYSILKKYLFVTIVLAILMYSLKVIAYALPGEKTIKPNIEKSMVQIKEEGIYPRLVYNEQEFYNYAGNIVDNWNDILFLNTCYWADSFSPFKMAAADYTVSSLTGDLSYESGNTSSNIVEHYGRQWFGMIIFIRPLLMLFTLPEIRIISQSLFLLLLMSATLRLYKTLNKKIAMAFFISIVCANLEIVPIALSISATFYIICIATIIATYIYSKEKNKISIYVFMYILGAITPYLDFWVTPVITYLFMMIILLSFEYYNGNIANLKECILKISFCGITWLLGCFILWTFKWSIATIATNKNVILDALNEILGWSYQRFPEWGPQTTSGLIKETLRLAFINIFPINILFTIKVRYGVTQLLICLLPFLIFLVVYFIKNKDLKRWYLSLSFVLIACIPYIFYIIVHSSSFNHIGSAYRLQCGAIFGIIMSYLCIVHDKEEGIIERRI